MDIAATPLARKLGHYIALSRDLSRPPSGAHPNRTPPRRAASEGESGQDRFVLMEGWACSYKLLPDGRRQIINFALPGDFLGLRSVLLRVADHSVASVTDIRVSPFSHADLSEISEHYARLHAAILWALSREEAIGSSTWSTSGDGAPWSASPTC
jgi:CRP-like cAMP-binding protein